MSIDIQPHEWALSVCMDPKDYVCVALTREEAVAYLRREALRLSPDVPRGLVLLTWQGVPLGFAKNVESRANNLYPQEWKIKTTHISAYETILRPAEPHPDGGNEKD